jgi:hypothetical protein
MADGVILPVMKICEVVRTEVLATLVHAVTALYEDWTRVQLLSNQSPIARPKFRHRGWLKQ